MLMCVWSRCVRACSVLAVSVCWANKSRSKESDFELTPQAAKVCNRIGSMNDPRTGLSRSRPRPPPALAPFIPSARFKGPRDGYVFKAGPAVPPVRPGHPSFVPEGAALGYYLELD